jgi:hypothetical protein
VSGWNSVRLSAGGAGSDDGHEDVLYWIAALTVFRGAWDHDNCWMISSVLRLQKKGAFWLPVDRILQRNWPK